MVGLGKAAAFSVEEVMEVPARTVPTANPGQMKGGSRGTYEEGRVLRMVFE